MKYLLVLLVVMVAIGIWRNGRRNEREPAPPPTPAAPPVPPTQMLSCRQCGVHLPPADAVAGRQGAYCSVDHRRLAEG